MHLQNWSKLQVILDLVRVTSNKAGQYPILPLPSALGRELRSPTPPCYTDTNRHVWRRSSSFGGMLQCRLSLRKPFNPSTTLGFEVSNVLKPCTSYLKQDKLHILIHPSAQLPIPQPSRTWRRCRSSAACCLAFAAWRPLVASRRACWVSASCNSKRSEAAMRLENTVFWWFFLAENSMAFRWPFCHLFCFHLGNLETVCRTFTIDNGHAFTVMSVNDDLMFHIMFKISILRTSTLRSPASHAGKLTAIVFLPQWVKLSCSASCCSPCRICTQFDPAKQ